MDAILPKMKYTRKREIMVSRIWGIDNRYYLIGPTHLYVNLFESRERVIVKTEWIKVFLQYGKPYSI